MGTRDPRIDAYIAKKAEFARPILEFLREVVHEGCPDVVENIKWGMPAFEYQGLLANMAAFKAHCTFGFWRGRHVLGPDGNAAGEAMGQFGRLTHRRDLPAKKVLVGYVKRAAKLNGEKSERPTRSARRPAKKPLRVPADLAAALAGNRRARATFDALSPSGRREYVEWLVGAKREATRVSRLRTAIAWLAEGKSYNWRYEKRG